MLQVRTRRRPKRSVRYPAEESEDAAEYGRQEEQQQTEPVPVLPRSGRRIHELGKGRPDDQREHKQLVRVEREADGCNDANQPLRRCEAWDQGVVSRLHVKVPDE
jgi:hypothetical protein